MLLREEVDAAASEQESRAQAARELLAGFGRPADVAARYGTPVSLVDPADTRRFLTLAVAGALLILFGAVLDELIDSAIAQRNLEQAVENAWPTVFAWLGLLVVGFAVSAWARRRQPDAGWKPHSMPTDQINRFGRAAGTAFFIVGTVVLVNPAWLLLEVTGGRAAPAASEAFAYDEEFLRLRGPVLLGFMVLGIVIQVILVWQGRWRAWLRGADLVHSLVMCVMLTWVVGAGPIFKATPTDEAVKGAIALIILVAVVDQAVRIRRDHVRQAIGIPAG
jgi:hypothetical protein